MKTTLFAAATFALALAAAPAFAGEGNSDPFPYAASGMTVAAQTGTNAAVSAETFPDPAGRPGSNLAQLADELLPGTTNEAVVQTATSLPRGFEEGTVSQAYVQSVNLYFVAQAQQGNPAYATTAVVGLARN